LDATLDTYGMRSEHILTSAIFKLATDRNPELEKQINRHAELTSTLKLDEAQRAELASLTMQLQDFHYVGVRAPWKVSPPSKEEADRVRKALEAELSAKTPEKAP
jgi:hypothetical protein